MKSQLTLNTILLLFVLGFVTACSSSGKLLVTQPRKQSIAPGKTVALLVEPDVAEPRPIHQEVASRVRERLFGKLVAEGLFKSVVHSQEIADYQMDVKIKGARQVSTGARIFLGVMAGSNNLNLDVKIHDQPQNQLITAFQVTGKSASHPFSSEAALDDAIREAVDKITQALR